MISLLGTALSALPALAGVVIGLGAITQGLVLPLAIATAVLIGLVAAGRGLLRSMTTFGAALIEASYLLATGVTALATVAIAWLVTSDVSWLKVSGDEALQKQIASAFSGAVAAYAGVVWTKDVADGKGAFWPETQFREGLASLHRQLGDRAPSGDTRGYALFWEDRVRKGVEAHEEPIAGWGFSARRARARQIEKLLAA